MSAIRELLDSMNKAGKHAVIGTVKAADAEALTCDVVFAGRDIIVEKIPLRIFNDDEGFGTALVPAIGSEALVGFVDGKENQPQVLKVQQWDWWIMRRGELKVMISPDNAFTFKRENGFEFTMTAGGKFLMGNAPAHKLIHGDTFLPKFNAHYHLAPDGPTTPPVVPIQVDEVCSHIFEVE